jgi:hypothetical protein
MTAPDDDTDDAVQHTGAWELLDRMRVVLRDLARRVGRNTIAPSRRPRSSAIQGVGVEAPAAFSPRVTRADSTNRNSPSAAANSTACFA